MINKIAHSLESRVLKNGGRWCEIRMKATGETFIVSRTGFKSVEDALYDSFVLVNEDGELVVTAANLFELAAWIHSNY